MNFFYPTWEGGQCGTSLSVRESNRCYDSKFYLLVMLLTQNDEVDALANAGRHT